MPLPAFVVKNKVRVIYAGGTIGMLPGKQGLVPGNNFASRLLPLLDESWFRKLNCELSFCELTPLLDSSAMNASHWFSFAAQLLEEESNYDAFVLLQGTDTLAWTASALHCLLGNFSRPLLLTASQLPLGAPTSDALNNFQFALEQALQLKSKSSESKVFIAFANKLLPPQASRKFHTRDFAAFTAIGQTNASKNTFWPSNGQLNAAELRHLAINFKPRLLRLPLIPSLNDAWLSEQLEGLDGLILEGLGSGNSPNLPLTFKRLAELHQEKKLPLGLTSQCWQGGVNTNYAAGAALLEAGALPLESMTPEYAETRLVCLLALQKLNKISVSDVLHYWLASQNPKQR